MATETPPKPAAAWGSPEYHSEITAIIRSEWAAEVKRRDARDLAVIMAKHAKLNGTPTR